MTEPIEIQGRLTRLEERQAEVFRRLDAIATTIRGMLPRELHDEFKRTFDQYISDSQKWRETVTSQLASSSGRDRGVALAFSVGIALSGVVFGLATIFSRL